MKDFWPECAWRHLEHDARGALVPSAEYLRHFLARPELALVPESCRAEKALHQALQQDPLRALPAAQLGALADADARQNYAHYLGFRDALQRAGTLEAWLLALMRSARIEVPPLFIDLVVQAIVRDMLDDGADALAARAAELLFRTQRVSVHEGRMLAGDRETLDLQQQTAGFGDLGRLLTQAQAPLRALPLPVLTHDRQAEYWADAARTPARHRFLLDLTPQITQELGHGVQFKLANAHSGLKALAGVLERWVHRLLGVRVTIRPVQRVDDPQWRWHVGLDAQSSALLNDLYSGVDVEASRMARLIGLFRLEFADPGEMRADVAGAPVHLGLMMDDQGLLRLKPQNLLLNLPLARGS